MNRYTHTLGKFLAQLIDVLTFFTDNNTGTCGVDRYPSGLRWPRNLNPTYGSVSEALAQVSVSYTHLTLPTNA